MARRCDVTGKGPMSGNKVSHSNIKTRRRFLPNVQIASLFSESLGRPVRLKASTAGIRTIEHMGGLDAFLLDASDCCLTPALRKIKRQVEAKTAKAA